MAATGLTNDEMTVLGITAQGESLAPIGRWEQPCKALAARGYLKALDPHNYVITPAGHTAFAVEEKLNDAVLGQMITKSNQIGSGHESLREAAESFAHGLVELGRASTLITGDTPAQAIQKWSPIILKRALELLNE